jgi:hypothetical protein
VWCCPLSPPIRKSYQNTGAQDRVQYDLMRATAQKGSDISANINHAASAWNVLVELCARCEEHWSWPMLFEAAVEELRQGDPLW